MSNGLGHAFINCPYDEEYGLFFKALVFLCFYFDFEPHFACEDSSSGSRQEKIVSLIQKTSVGIHDISRTSISSLSGLPRFNMPFELGMDVMHCAETDKQKRLLVLDGRRGDYEKTLSDIKCADIEAHGGTLPKLFSIVRNFFLQMGTYQNVKGSNWILNYFQLTFSAWLQDNLKDCEIDMESEVSMLEYKQKVSQFFEYGYGDKAKRAFNSQRP